LIFPPTDRPAAAAAVEQLTHTGGAPADFFKKKHTAFNMRV
jgi:hypothetical protein